MKAVIVLVLLAGTVAAQPVNDDRAKAASHFKQGQLYFKSGDYDRAISEYQAAYALSQEPLLLFNIGLCNDRAGRPEQALSGFQHYLDLAPNGEVAEEAREDVVRLTPIVDAIRAKRDAEAVAEAASKANEARKADEAKRADDLRHAEALAQERERRRIAAEPLEGRARLERWGGLAAGGVGLVALGLGIKFGLDARADADAISGHTSGAWTDAILAKDADGRDANTKMLVFTGVGGALLVGGGVLYLLGVHTNHEAETLRLTVAPSGVALSGRF